MRTKPPSLVGVPEAESILRMLKLDGSQGTLNGIAVRHGLATPQDDAATVRARLRRAAEAVMRGQPQAEITKMSAEALVDASSALGGP